MLRTSQIFEMILSDFVSWISEKLSSILSDYMFQNIPRWDDRWQKINLDGRVFNLDFAQHCKNWCVVYYFFRFNLIKIFFNFMKFTKWISKIKWISQSINVAFCTFFSKFSNCPSWFFNLWNNVKIMHNNWFYVDPSWFF